MSDFTRFSWNRGLPFCHLYAFDSFFVFCRCACCTLIGSCRVIFLSFSVANGLGITVCILPSNNYKNHPLGGTRAVLLPSFLRLERFAVQMCGELFFVWLRLIFCSAKKKRVLYGIYAKNPGWFCINMQNLSGFPFRITFYLLYFPPCFMSFWMENPVLREVLSVWNGSYLCGMVRWLRPIG